MGSLAETECQDSITQCGGAHAIGNMGHAGVFGVTQHLVPQIAASRDITNATAIRRQPLFAGRHRVDKFRGLHHTFFDRNSPNDWLEG